MINEVMIARAQALVDKNDVEYINTVGNTHNFQGRGHNISKDKIYIITAEIQQNNEMVWSCDCHHAQFNDECKHGLACQILMKDKELRDEYKALSNDEYYNKHKDDMIVMIDKDKTDDEVVGKVVYKMESDDD